MSNAVKCPVCEGLGKVNIYREDNNRTTTSEYNNMRTCHGCGGAGWVVVP